MRPTGRFRVYLGAAAGVGKTCAMLDEGWRRFQRGPTCAVGFVETHKRPFTTQQISDLPVVPRKQVEYRGSNGRRWTWTRCWPARPRSCSSTSWPTPTCPGRVGTRSDGRTSSRLLDAGIAVITTVNIQHIESLADAGRDGSPASGSRERVPDWVVRRADQIELIDSSADQLRRRMLHGNIYPAEKVQAALNGFFRAENLVALRELSLRFVADETEEELLEYLRSKGAGGEVWETTERIMVAVTGPRGMHPSSGGRRASQARVRATTGRRACGVRRRRGPRGQRHRPSSRSSWRPSAVPGRRCEGDDVAKTIFAAAVDQQITQIVWGPRGSAAGSR